MRATPMLRGCMIAQHVDAAARRHATMPPMLTAPLLVPPRGRREAQLRVMMLLSPDAGRRVAAAALIRGATPARSAICALRRCFMLAGTTICYASAPLLRRVILLLTIRAARRRTRMMLRAEMSIIIIIIYAAHDATLATIFDAHG